MAIEIIYSLFMQYKEALAQYPYIYALTVLVAFFLIAKTFVFIVEGFLLKLAAQTKTSIDDLILRKVKGPISVILFLIGIRIAVIPLELGGFWTLFIGRVVLVLVILIVAYIAIIIFDTVIDAWGKQWAARTKSAVDDHLLNLFHKISRIVIMVIAFLFILDSFGIKTGPLITSLGVAGIAVAFAMQNTLGNIFGGMSLIIDRSIKVGEVIQLDDKTIGTVTDIGLRSTKIKTFDNEMIIIPNNKLANSKILNYAPPDPSARLVVPFSVAYGSKIDKVKKVVLDSIKAIDEVKEDPAPFVRFLEMGDSSLNFKLYLYVKHYNKRFAVKDVVNTKVYNALNKAKINIPFPQMDVHLKK